MPKNELEGLIWGGAIVSTLVASFFLSLPFYAASHFFRP
jgi:hypothetical protein